MRSTLIIGAIALSLAAGFASAQQPPPSGAAAPGGGRGGRFGGLPGATPEQLQAVTDMTTTLAPLAAAVTTARSDLAAATFTGQKNEAAIQSAVDKVKAAEFALAMKRAEEFAKIQAGPSRLSTEQVIALIAVGGSLPAGRGAGRGRGGA